MSFVKLCVLLIVTIMLSMLQLSIQFQSFRIHRLSRPIKSLPSLCMKGDIDPDETEGYGPVGSLLRQGPVPFFIRVVNPSTYDAAVNKYMNGEKCSKLEAMANMDAYFQDPNGWALNKQRERKGGVKIDYSKANVDKGSLVLTATWSLGLFYLVYRLIKVQVFHLEP